MRRWAWWAVVLAVAVAAWAVAEVPGAEASRAGRKNKEKKKAHRGAHETAAAAQKPNLCDIREHDVNVYCYCNTQELNNATEATCLIFKVEKGADDPAWDYFSSQTNLERLKLSTRPDGRLRAVPAHALRLLPHLRVLDVQYGMLRELPPYAFANLTNLSEVTLSRNQITSLARHALANLPQLEQLNLDQNLLAELRRDCLQLPSLKRLFLARNNLSLLQDRALAQLPSLEELDLTGNDISVVTRDTFSGLKALKRLNLEENRLTVLGERAFAELQALEELVLDENELQLIDARALWGLARLRRLSLAGNRLKALPADVLVPASRLRALDLRDNELSSLSAAAARPLLPALRGAPSPADQHDGVLHAALHLEGNNFLCDCRLSWMYTLRNETTNEQVRNALEELTCILTEQLEGSSMSPIDWPDSEEPDFVRDAPIGRGNTGNSGNTVSEENYDETNSSTPPDGRKHLFDIAANLLPCPQELTRSGDGTARSNMVEDYEFGLELYAKMAAPRASPAMTMAILCVLVATALATGT